MGIRRSRINRREAGRHNGRSAHASAVRWGLGLAKGEALREWWYMEARSARRLQRLAALLSRRAGPMRRFKGGVVVGWRGCVWGCVE